MSSIGIAFGGGGTRGLAHVGILRSLRRRRELLPRYAAGTSAGSIVAALYAADVAQERIEEAVHEFDWFRNVVSLQDTAKNILDSRSAGIVSNRRIETTVNELIGNRTFEELPRELAIVATELDGNRRVVFASPRMRDRIDTAVLEAYLPPPTEEKPGCETVVVTDLSSVGAAVAASCAIPGLFHAVSIGDMRLVDGGIVDQIPVDVVRAMGAKPVIGISLSFAMATPRARTLGSLFSTVLSVLGTQQLRRSLDLAEVGFQIPGIGERSMFDTRQYDLIDIGEEAMEKHIERLASLA